MKLQKEIFAWLLLYSVNHIIAQDTSIIQTFTFDSATRNEVFSFPNDNSVYEKILMQYTIRCKDGLISNSSNTNLGCGEWDYSCNTYITDSSVFDSASASFPNYVINDFSETTFGYTTQPVYTFYQYNQQKVSYDSVISEVTANVGSDTLSLNHPFSSGKKTGKAQYLWTASELSSTGLISGNITGMKLDINSFGSELNFLKIKIKTTTKSSLDSTNVDLTGFAEAYFLNTKFNTAGLQSFNFYNPFYWDGTSNIIVDISFTNYNAGIENIVYGDSVGFVSGLISSGSDFYLDFEGAQQVNVPNSVFDSISDEITIALWCYGNPSIMPANSTIFEGRDNENNRQVNVHLPWSDSQVYWDCGNDGTGYDRINKKANAVDFKGTWNHWAFTKNATSGSMKIYLNGNKWSSGTGKSKKINISEFKIGSAVTWNNFYYGFIDEFSIWNKELDENAIRKSMRSNIDATHPYYSNLLAYYAFNDTLGSVATDASPNAASATLTGNPVRNFIKGENIYRNFHQTFLRPNVSFVQGVYDSTFVQTSIEMDSVLNSQRSIYSYQIIKNSLKAVDTMYAWQAGNYFYTLDENGNKVDSSIINAEQTLIIQNLDYFNKFPQKLEMMSFVTPYGINLDLGINGRMYEFDVTDFSPVLKGNKRLSIEGGAWQEDMDIRFVFIKGTPPRNVIDIKQLWPVSQAGYASIMNNERYEPRTIQLPSTASQFKIRSVITGHGQEGEFIPQTHFININEGAKEFQWEVWKKCADNPIYPQGGTWLFDRAGWCPGAPSELKEMDITSMVSSGQSITIDYGVNSGEGDSRYLVNNQLISYSSPNFTLDAAVSYVKRPSDRAEFMKINPICNNPIVAIQNTGSTPLASLQLDYYVDGGIKLTYNWTGSLDFLESEEVTLPIKSIEFWNGSGINEFHIEISNPNGGQDQYEKNNNYVSEFTPFTIYNTVNSLFLNYKTNNRASENSYTIKDTKGNVVLSRSGLADATIYKDELELQSGCYTLEFLDSGEDGLDYWYWDAVGANVGTGYFKLRKDADNGTILKTFEPDFGNVINYEFSVPYPLNVENLKLGYRLVSVYPNPSNDVVTIELHGFDNKKITMELYNLLGQKKHTENIITGNTTNFIQLIDIKHLETGMYFLKIISGSDVRTFEIVKER